MARAGWPVTPEHADRRHALGARLHQGTCDGEQPLVAEAVADQLHAQLGPHAVGEVAVLAGQGLGLSVNNLVGLHS